MLTKSIPANETRLPDPVPGEAMVVSKYSDDRRKAVILHPDDFDLFERHQRIFGARDAYELHLSETAVRAHAIGERGEDEPISTPPRSTSRWASERARSPWLRRLGCGSVRSGGAVQAVDGRRPDRRDDSGRHRLRAAGA